MQSLASQKPKAFAFPIVCGNSECSYYDSLGLLIEWKVYVTNRDLFAHFLRLQNTKDINML